MHRESPSSSLINLASKQVIPLDSLPEIVFGYSAARKTRLMMCITIRIYIKCKTVEALQFQSGEFLMYIGGMQEMGKESKHSFACFFDEFIVCRINRQSLHAITERFQTHHQTQILLAI
jgi:hypothetical protein